MQFSTPSQERQVVFGHVVNSDTADITRGEWVKYDVSSAAQTADAVGLRVLRVAAADAAGLRVLAGCAEEDSPGTPSTVTPENRNTFMIVVFGHHPAANVYASSGLDPIGRNGDLWLAVDPGAPGAGTLRYNATPALINSAGCGGFALEEIVVGDINTVLQKNVWVRCMRIG
jgi:hypothetical protein